MIDFDSDRGQDVHKVRLTAKLPGSISAIAKDAFSNLRDALDHAVYSSATALRPGKIIARTAFPFALDADGVHLKLNRELIDIPPEIRTHLEALRPHKRGNPALWGLNSIRNIKTHRILVPVGAASIGSTTSLRGLVTGPSQIGYHRWDGAKNEVEYLRLGRGSNVSYDVHVSFGVLFGNVEIFGGKPAVATLREIAAEVESIVRAIEVETCRLLNA